MIVVFCPTSTSPYYVMLLQGIEAVANERGYGVFICNTQRDARLEEKYLRMIRAMAPQGIIYACNPHPDYISQVEEMARRIPLVIISNKEKISTGEASAGSGTSGCGLYYAAAYQKTVAAFQTSGWFCP